MAIIPKWTRQGIKTELDAQRQKLEEGMFKILVRALLEFVSDARSMTKGQGGFGDDTGNLRSSIGGVILKDGQVVFENFELFKDGVEGKNDSYKLINEVKVNSGYQIVGVAGRNYASYVESKGYNVITAQADVSIVSIEKLLNKYASRLNALGVSVTFDITGSVITTNLQ